MPDMNENAETQQEYFGVHTDNKETLQNALKRIDELKNQNKKLKGKNAELKEKVEGYERIRDKLIAMGFPTFMSCKEYAAQVKELEQKLEQTEKDLADYQFNYPSIKELSKENAELKTQNEKMKCYLPVDERDSNHKYFAYKNLFETKWHIDYSVEGGLPKCNTIKWFENKEAVMYYLVTNGMSYKE